ncbi:MAG: IS481 family transposase [Acidimicrobiales bacterium]
MSHRNARLTPAGRKILIERIAAGRPIAHVAAEMGISRATAHKWWRRWQIEGTDGLQDRSSRPHRCPTRTRRVVEDRIVRLRRTRKWGPARISMLTGVPSSTVWAVLARRRLNRLAWMDRPTGRVIRRYERQHPGELVHLDIKKVGRIPPGGGWRVHGRGATKTRRVGYTYLHVAVDDYSRVAYVEAHDNEKAETLVGFWRRAQDWFWTRGMPVDEVLTDNGGNFRSDDFADVLAERAIKHRRTRPYRPQTNGKAERFNRTMADEFLYARVFRSENERRQRLDHWIHLYNHHRNHTAIGGPPASRVHNLTGQYS